MDVRTWRPGHRISRSAVQLIYTSAGGDAIREREYPNGDMVGFFQEVKIIQTNRGLNKEGEREKKEVTFFYGKMATISSKSGEFYRENG